MKKLLVLATLAATAVGCASFNGPKGRFTSNEFDAQRPGRLIFEYPIDSTKKPRMDVSYIAFDEHREDQSSAEKANFIVRPPSRAHLLHHGIDLEVRDHWMMSRVGDAPYMRVLWVAVADVQVTRFPAAGLNGDLSQVDSLSLRASGVTIRVARHSSISVVRDTVHVVVQR